MGDLQKLEMCLLLFRRPGSHVCAFESEVLPQPPQRVAGRDVLNDEGEHHLMACCVGLQSRIVIVGFL